MARIHELSDDVIAQISAGEVVTRAGDVVKELIENAVDAVLAHAGAIGASGASLGSIAVEIRDGGHTLIQVADDGIGMAPDDLPLALRRHATSKIVTAEDLDTINSLGFRGEALASISAVADVEIVSATVEATLGNRLLSRDGEPVQIQPHARRRGTSITVERLFDRVPARRKYQRAPAAETAYCARLVQTYALIFPEISFSFMCDGRAVLRTLGTGDLRDAAVAVFGPEPGRELLTLRDDRAENDPSIPSVTVTGLIGTPALHRATRNGIFLAVNRRPIDSRALMYAVEEAYATQIPVGRHPIAILDLTVPLAEVDPNVHPTKREVRLLRERLGFGIVHHVVRNTLSASVGIPRLGETRGQLVQQSVSSDDGSEVPLALRGFSPEPSDPLDATRSPDSTRPRLGQLRILGQVALTYIICEGRAGLYLVDQHAAHERVLLERLEHNIGRQGQFQYLLSPLVVELPRVLRGALDEYVGCLLNLGFEVAPFGEAEVVVRAIPAALRAREVNRVLQETHESLDEEGAGPDWRERLALLLSCKTAVKAGQRLEIAEMQSLLEQLDEATLCATCSHGRPTAILLTHSQLEREFGRS